MQLNLPILDQLANSENILIAGAGGGQDILAGLPLFFTLRDLGKTVHLANFSFSPFEIIPRLCDADVLIDTLLLGCTHYPLLAPSIRAIVGEETAVIDSATATASSLASLIEVHDLGTTDAAPGQHRMLTTGDVTAFSATASRLFGEDLGVIEGLELAGGTELRVGP